MERVNQIRMMNEINSKTYVRPSEPVLGASKGFY